MSKPKLVVGAFTRLRPEITEKPADKNSSSSNFFVLESVAADRYSVCVDCDRLRSNKFCRQCGCFMPAKTKLKRASCPLGKWAAE